MNSTDFSAFFHYTIGVFAGIGMGTVLLAITVCLSRFGIQIIDRKQNKTFNLYKSNSNVDKRKPSGV